MSEEKNYELNLLEKTELWVNDIRLDHCDLNEIARVVASVLNMEKEKVLVVDVRDNHITLDILKNTVNSSDIVGKEKQLLRKLAEISGVYLGEQAGIHSEGILGLIAMPKQEIENSLQRSEQMVQQMRERIARRVKIFPTGFEVKKGLIKDTNSPMLLEAFQQRGYQASLGDVIEDDRDDVYFQLNNAVDQGFGLVITTGGVGAEDKDHTVEGILQLDPEAATPWIVKYQQGTGRHCKEGVRIAVGKVDETFLIALPGPNDEVRIAMDVIFNVWPQKPDKYILAERIAGALRHKLKVESRNAFYHQLEEM